MQTVAASAATYAMPAIPCPSGQQKNIFKAMVIYQKITPKSMDILHKKLPCPRRTRQHFLKLEYNYQPRFAAILLWKNFTVSTMTMVMAPSPIAMRYSVKEIAVKPKAFARTGISQTTVVSTRVPAAAP